MTLDVLLIEDDPAKKNRLLTFLESRKGEMFGRIETCLCTAHALALLAEHQFDLLIADVMVPAALGGEPREENAIDLFQQIDEGARGLIRPRYSIAISASDGLSSQAKEFFIGRPWGILRYDETTEEFQVTIAKICEYIACQSVRGNQSGRTCDVFLITALAEPEFLALEALGGFEWAALEPLDDTQFVRFGSLMVDGNRRTIAAAFSPRMGPVSAAVLTTKAMLLLKPKLVLMSGICAGIPGKSSIGDVVAAELSWDWQSGKYIDKNGEESFEIAPHQIHVDDRLRAALVLFKRESAFWNSLAPLAAKNAQNLPKMIVGPMASGSAVLADVRVSDRIKATQHRSVVALDMEVYAVYAAAQASNPEVMFCALKSVCDQGDKQKDDKYQEYAAQISAAATVHFIQTYGGRVL